MGSLGLAGQMANAGNNYYGMATNPYATQAFMNPYLQNALNPMLEESRRQYGMNQTNQMGNATRAGAFGGSREALMAAENNRNMNTAMNQMIGQGYNTAFDQAQKNIQYGAGLGLQGQQGALQGYGQGIQAANALGQLGTAQLQGQEGILGLQNQMGALQQNAEQTKINQAIQNYATAQQYPMMQLGLMSNMTRGLPMQATTTQSYQAQPSALTQGIGALGAGFGAMKAFGAKGGLPQDFEMRYEEGGVAEDIKSQLESMDPARLEQVLRSSTSAEVKKMASQILAERKMAEQAMSRGIGAAPSGMATKFAGGGIVAFAGDTDGSLVEEDTRGGYVPPPEAPVKDPFAVANPYAETPEAALEKYMALRKTAGAGKDDPYEKYGAALQAKLADADAAKQRMHGENMMQYFTNLGTQPGSVLKAGLMAGRETMPDIIKNRQNFDKEQLGYEAANTELMSKRDAAAEARAKEASVLYEKGAEIADKIKAKLIEAKKAKSLPNLQELTNINYEYLLVKDPSIKNDPVKAAEAKVRASKEAVQQIGSIQQLIAGERTAVQREGVGVSQQGVDVSRVTASTSLDDKEQARADAEIAKDGRLKKWATDLYGAETPKEEKAILDKIEARETAIRKRVNSEFAPSRRALESLGGGGGGGNKASKEKPKEVNFSDLAKKDKT
jgi:hypothetical protein